MLLIDDVLEKNQSFEKFMNPPTCAQSRYSDPHDMELEIRAETDRLLQELWTEKKLESSLDENRPIPMGKDGENVIYIYRKLVMRKGGKQKVYPHIRFEALVGSPLYIALYLKRYEEAAKLLEMAPYTAAPGYAVLPATVHYRNVSGEIADSEYPAEVTFHLDKAIYLQDMVLLDKDIPDDLFVALCRRLAERKESGAVDLPCRYEGRIGKRENRLRAEDPGDVASAYWGYADRSCHVPSLIREFACWTDLKRHYGELAHVDKDWGDRLHSPEESKTYRESVLSDEELYWKVLKGLERLKKLDEGLFRSWVDKRTTAHFLVRYMFIIFDFLTSHYSVAANRMKVPQRLREMKEPIDACARAGKLKAVLKKFGYDEISADVLWDAFTDLGHGVSSACNGFWVGLELWKLVFQKELVLEVQEDVKPFGFDLADRGVELLAAIFCCEVKFELADPAQDGVLKYVYSQNAGSSIQSSKCFLEMVDGIQWKTESVMDRAAFLEHRHAVEETVLGTKDKELLYLCMEKNIFPASDMMFLSEKTSEELEDMLPLMVMKQHGYL